MAGSKWRVASDYDYDNDSDYDIQESVYGSISGDSITLFSQPDRQPDRNRVMKVNKLNR